MGNEQGPSTILQQRGCAIRDLGLIDYQEAYALQKESVDRVLRGGLQEILLCEHPAVLTLGRLANEKNLLVGPQVLLRKGIKVLPVDRGGDVTLHAPGQLVVYPILDLNCQGRDLRSYLQMLEQVAIDFLNSFDIVASRFPSQTGVWVGEKKIVSIGIGVRKWISFHGLAVNVNTDLRLFSVIKPCGLNVAMTSMREIKGRVFDMVTVKARMAEYLCRTFHLKQREKL